MQGRARKRTEKQGIQKIGCKGESGNVPKNKNFRKSDAEERGKRTEK